MRSADLRRWRLAYGALALTMLILPLVAMRFTAAMNWGLEDFAAAAALFILLGLALELTLRRAATRPGQAAGASLAVAAFLLVWAELAVGILPG